MHDTVCLGLESTSLRLGSDIFFSLTSVTNLTIREAGLRLCLDFAMGKTRIWC